VSLRCEGESTAMSEFEAQVRANQRRVFQIAYAVLADAAEAEDVAQEAFLQAFRRLRSLREPERFRAWIGRIVYRLALNRRRSLLRERSRETVWQGSQPSGVGSEKDTLDQLFLDRVRREIDLLPEKLRSVLVLCAIEGMEASEAAWILKVPEGTVRSRLHLARKRLLSEVKP